MKRCAISYQLDEVSSISTRRARRGLNLFAGIATGSAFPGQDCNGNNFLYSSFPKAQYPSQFKSRVENRTSAYQAPLATAIRPCIWSQPTTQPSTSDEGQTPTPGTSCPTLCDKCCTVTTGTLTPQETETMTHNRLSPETDENKKQKVEAYIYI